MRSCTHESKDQIFLIRVINQQPVRLDMTFSNVLILSRIYKLMIAIFSVQSFVIDEFVEDYSQRFRIKASFQRSFVIFFELRPVFDLKNLTNPSLRRL